MCIYIKSLKLFLIFFPIRKIKYEYTNILNLKRNREVIDFCCDIEINK